MRYISESAVCVCHSLSAIYYCMPLPHTTGMCCGLLCPNVSTCLASKYILISLSPYTRPLRGCPHLQAVTEWARCVGVGRSGPGNIQAGTSCMGQTRRRQPIWGFKRKRETGL